jgi:pyruvate dehydrogenase E2 component (dihydrolipoamide acetyltransferase)
MSTIQIAVPDIGDVTDVEVIEVLVKPGDTVKAEQSLITVESDKASMEIPSSHAGVVRELKVKLGDKVSQGSLVLVLETTELAASTTVVPAVAVTAAAVAAPPVAPQVAAPAVPTPVSTLEVRVPDIGDSHDVEVIEILVKAGDAVKAEQSLITVESDKASMEIPAPSAGVIVDLKVKLGDKVNQGDLIAMLQGSWAAPVAASGAASIAAATSSVEQAASVPAASATSASATAPVVANDDALPLASKPHASPSIRKFARELGVDLTRVSGNGPKGRITQEDVQAYVKGVVSGAVAAQGATPAKAASGGNGLTLLPWPSLDFSKFGETELLPLSRIKKISGPNLARNWAVIPHVTQFDEADITDLEQFRKQTNEAMAKSGMKTTMLAFVMKACATLLKQYPSFNSSLDAKGENLILKKYVHIGFAADTPNGLVVPVLRDCDKKGIGQIAKETSELAAKARDGKLGAADMQGACFTISSLGGVGGTMFTPIINAPEVAILGLSKSDIKPKWDEKRGEFSPRLMLPLSLSYDHRVIDGAQAARFTTALGDLLADMRRVLL